MKETYSDIIDLSFALQQFLPKRRRKKSFSWIQPKGIKQKLARLHYLFSTLHTEKVRCPFFAKWKGNESNFLWYIKRFMWAFFLTYSKMNELAVGLKRLMYIADYEWTNVFKTHIAKLEEVLIQMWFIHHTKSFEFVR
jgi:hypothetical protein